MRFYGYNRMDEKEALEVVIPCHYNLPALFTKNYCYDYDIGYKKKLKRLAKDT